ncbi:MAG: hypothetical protein RI539_05000 [Spiribacter sp.]|jgi:hypothetical protein|nr:hypothetical protein [Spiribacter sp.]MDR9489688.1 hypothetical protein [Spiribacter sp.]
MRALKTQKQEIWQVDVLFASYGAFYLIFSSQDGSEPYKTPLSADSQWQAERALAVMSEDDLQRALAQAVPFSEVNELGF